MPRHNERDLQKAAFAQKLGRLMDEKGWNQSDLARAAEKYLPKGETFRRDNVHVYLARAALPRPKQLNAIARALGVQPEDLLPGVSNAPKLPYAMAPVEGEPGMSYLQVDMKVPMRTALAVLALLDQTGVTHQ